MKDHYSSNNKKLNTSNDSNDVTKSKKSSIKKSDNDSSSDSNDRFKDNTLNSSFTNFIIRDNDGNDYNNQISSYIKSLYDTNKHGYKNDHITITNSTNISNNLKEDYISYYNAIEGMLNELRKAKKNKESFNKKLQPGLFSTPTKEEEEQSKKLTIEITKLESEKERLKNELYLYQSILLKNKEKISSLFSEEKVKYFNDYNIYYLDINYINSSSYETQQLLKKQKYKELIDDNSYIESLKSTEIVDFLQYLAEGNNTDYATQLFQNNEYIRLDVFNHLLNNEFWIEIYSQEQFQGYIDNFYRYNQNNYDYANNNNYPQIPYWGEVILSNNQDLDQGVVDNIIKNYLGNELANTLNKAANLIDNDAEISDNQYNLIYNLKSYLSSAQGAEKVDDRLVESKNKIASFIEKPSNDDVLLSNTNGISSIENGNIYEYNNSSLVKKISTTIHTTADSQTDLNTLQFNTLFQYSKSKQIANYIYILLYYFGKA